jgi:hypothetical protein
MHLEKKGESHQVMLFMDHVEIQIDSEQFEKILRYIKSGAESNATLECGGQRFGSKGYFIQPTVFSNVQVIDAPLCYYCSPFTVYQSIILIFAMQ